MALEITNENLNSLLSEKEIVVVDFWAPWCGPCKMMGPIVDDLAKGYNNESIAMGKSNVDENGELAARFGIRGIPTLVFFKNGEAVDRVSGVKSIDEIEQIINNL